MRYWLLFLALTAFLSSQTVAAKSAWTLNDLYLQALNQSEAVLISAEQIRETRARFMQILGGSLPQIGHSDTVIIQDTAATGSGDDVGSTFTRRHREESKFYFHQPVFQGFAEYHTAKIQRASISKETYELKQEELNLFADISAVFITWVRLGRDIGEYQNIIRVARNRSSELQGDVELGKARASQGYAEQTELKLLEVRVEQLRSDRLVAEEALMWMTGLKPLPKTLAPRFNLKHLPPATQGVAQRPDVKAQQEVTKISEGELKVSRSKLLPHINADANYYHYRTGFQNQIDWDATFSLDLPVFNAQNWGEIKAGKSRLRQAALLERQVLKAAGQRFEKARIRFESARKQVQLVVSAAGVARQRFQSTEEDLRVGRTSTLDILEAQRYYLETLTQKNQVQANLELAYVNYWLETGHRP